MKPNITLCEKICNECGFSTKGTTNTLYDEAYDIIRMGTLFPCHMYLKSITGSESHGTEHLTTVKVCRGYVAYMSLYAPYPKYLSSIWKDLFNQLDMYDIDSIHTPQSLIESHIGLREHIALNNSLGSIEK